MVAPLNSFQFETPASTYMLCSISRRSKFNASSSPASLLALLILRLNRQAIPMHISSKRPDLLSLDASEKPKSEADNLGVLKCDY